MSTSVLSHMESRNARRTQRVTENAELAKTFMALIANMINICNKRGLSLRDVSFGTPSVTGHQLRTKVFWSAPSANTARGFERRSSVFEYARAKAARMAKALEECPALDRLVGQVADSMEGYAAFKGRPYKAVKIGHAFISANSDLVLELGF